MELMIIRHGLPLKVENTDGQAADPELSPTGVAQAEKMSQWLSAEKLDVIYSSPMKRALMTAEPLARNQNLEIRVEPGVAEIDQHASTYIPIEEIKKNYPDQWQKMIEEGVEKTFNAFQDLDTFKKNVVETIRKIIDTHRGKRVAIVSHGGIVNVWAAHILDIKQAMFFVPDYTSINRFMASSSGVHTLKSLNEAAHLRNL